MIKLKDLLSEMPQITKKGKKVFAGDVDLKNLPVEEVFENIIIFHSEKETFLTPAGFTLVYFMDSKEAVDLIRQDKIPLITIPDRHRFDFNSSPITDIWKKRRKPGQNRILGVIQAIVDDKEIYVDKMSVRPGYKQNSINSKMIQRMEKNWPNRVTNFSGPTKDGSEFIKKFTGADWKPAHGENPEV